MNDRLAAAEAALKANRPTEAIEHLAAALEADPQAPLQVYRVLITKLYQLGRYEEGADWARRATDRFPKSYDLLNLRGVLLRRLGRFDEALEVLSQAQKLDPKNNAALVNKANVLNDIGDGPAAEAAFSVLVRREPRNAEYQRGLGRALLRQGKLDPAAVRLRQAVSLRKDFVDAWLDLAGMELDRQRSAEALAILDRALEATPDQERLLRAKAGVLRRMGRARVCEEFLAGLLPRMEQQAWLQNELGKTLLDYDRPRANAHLERAVALAPDNLDFRFDLIESLARSRYGDEGAHIQAAFEQLKAALTRGRLGPAQLKIAREVLFRVCAHDDAAALGDMRSLGRLWASSGRHSALMLQMAQVRTQEDRLEVVQQHRTVGDLYDAAAARNPIVRPPPRPAGGKLRVGFMSSDLRNHPVGYFAMPLFEHYDRDRFEVYCYSYFQGAEDGAQRRITSLVDGFRWRQEISDREAAQMIADDQLDFLLELGGSTHMNKLAVMSYRPARLQGSWLGYPHSAGPASIDYLMVDPYMNPTSRDLLIEEPLVLRNTWFILGPPTFRDDQPIASEPAWRRNGFVTFGTANQPYKYTPEGLASWARIVAAVPDSRFLFVRPEGGTPEFRKNILAAFAAQGVAPERVAFEAVRGAHLPFYDQMDISLDTFPHTGGTTTCESLWMGVPVVTLAGEALFERLSLSINSNAGLADLCARSIAEYEEIAVRLASDRERLAALKSGLRGQVKASPLGQTREFARDFFDAVAGAVAARS